MREGKVRRTGSLTVRMCASPSSHMRVGLVVPLHGRTAVMRNRLKRRLRELVRTGLLEIPAPVDVLIHCGARTYLLTFESLQAEMQKARLVVAGHSLEND